MNPIIFYIFAIILALVLFFIGVKMSDKKPKNHE